MWLLFIVLALALIIGSALILLHTAKKPKLPPAEKDDEYC